MRQILYHFKQSFLKMKTFLILSVVCACAFAAPSVSLVGSPIVASPLFAHAAPVLSPVAQPLLAQVEGEAPASTVHAKHVHQVLAPQVISYSIPAAAPQIISSYSVPALAPAHVISAYSLPAPIVSLHVNNPTRFMLVNFVFSSLAQISHSAYKIVY